MPEINYSELFVEAFDNFEKKLEKEHEGKTTRSSKEDRLSTTSLALKNLKSDAEDSPLPCLGVMNVPRGTS